jgi:hypothetical protein
MADKPNGTAQRKDHGRLCLVIGWAAVGVTVAFACVWTFWGIAENFHEGWYSKSVWENLAMLFVQYLSVPAAFIALAAVSLRWRVAGLALPAAVALFALWFFRSAGFIVAGLMIVLPIALLGSLYFFGRPRPKKWAYRLIVLLPLVILLSVTPVKLVQVSQRADDGDFGTRLVEGNGVTLVWAPRGPGWPNSGVSYGEAAERCRYLSEDGMTLMDTPQDIWRLPTAEEAVRCTVRRGQNAGGVWDAAAQTPSYRVTPDKETPLWDPHSQIIYYWTGTECGDGQAFNHRIRRRRISAQPKQRVRLSFVQGSERPVKDAGAQRALHFKSGVARAPYHHVN